MGAQPSTRRREDQMDHLRPALLWWEEEEEEEEEEEKKKKKKKKNLNDLIQVFYVYISQGKDGTQMK